MPILFNVQQANQAANLVQAQELEAQASEARKEAAKLLEQAEQLHREAAKAKYTANELRGITNIRFTTATIIQAVRAIINNSTGSVMDAIRTFEPVNAEKYAKKKINKFQRQMIEEAFAELALDPSIDFLGSISVASIKRCGDFSSAMNEFKVQLNQHIEIEIMKAQIAQQDQRIAALEAEVALLKQLQVKDSARITAIEDVASVVANATNWKDAALQLKKQGMSNADIVKATGKHRNSISAYLNQPEIKAQWDI